MTSTFRFGVDLLDNPRYDSKPTQPQDPGEMTHEEEMDLFNATLGRPEIADMVAETVVDELTTEQWRAIVIALFRAGSTRIGDWTEASRLIHKACWPRVKTIVDGESHNTDMSKN